MTDQVRIVFRVLLVLVVAVSLIVLSILRGSDHLAQFMLIWAKGDKSLGVAEYVLARELDPYPVVLHEVSTVDELLVGVQRTIEFPYNGNYNVRAQVSSGYRNIDSRSFPLLVRLSCGGTDPVQKILVYKQEVPSWQQHSEVLLRVPRDVPRGIKSDCLLVAELKDQQNGSDYGSIEINLSVRRATHY
ncbi:hypothetical protein J2T60_001312 [Natronospira proteinivora]|uniref:C2 domain-containing protein n=1 Tax=Natronospira proteinivora TaxID=1807133 RepID=A0ABT1G8G5_9GAMM|nr:hypothetical protein [Natronospira proteinivora]